MTHFRDLLPLVRLVSTREDVGCGGNEDVKMDEWSHQAEGWRNIKESSLKWYGHLLRRV